MSENISYSIIDTAPANHLYTGGLLCNLQDPASDRLPDYICGEQTGRRTRPMLAVEQITSSTS